MLSARKWDISIRAAATHKMGKSDCSVPTFCIGRRRDGWSALKDPLDSLASSTTYVEISLGRHVEVVCDLGSIVR